MIQPVYNATVYNDELSLELEPRAMVGELVTDCHRGVVMVTWQWWFCHRCQLFDDRGRQTDQFHLVCQCDPGKRGVVRLTGSDQFHLCNLSVLHHRVSDRVHQVGSWWTRPDPDS